MLTLKYLIHDFIGSDVVDHDDIDDEQINPPLSKNTAREEVTVLRAFLASRK